MKAIFEFDLPEDEREYQIMNQADKMYSILWDFAQQLRSWRKYHNDFENANDALSKISDEFYRLIGGHGINLDL